MLDADIINPTSCGWRKKQNLSRWWELILPSMTQMFKMSLCTAPHHSGRSEVVLLANIRGQIRVLSLTKLCHFDKIWLCLSHKFSKVKKKVRELLIKALNKTQACLPFCANSRRRRKSTQLMADNYKNTVLLYIVQHIAFINTEDVTFHSFQSSLNNITYYLC